MTAAAFHYGPRERRGVFLGLTVAQVVGAFAGAGVSIAVAGVVGGTWALPLILGGLVLTAAAVAVVPVGLGLVQYAAGMVTGRRRWVLPVAEPRPVRRLDFLPAELGRLSTTSTVRNHREVGVFLDNGRPVAVIPVHSRGAFPLRDTDDQREVSQHYDAAELDRQVVRSRIGLRRGVETGTSLTAAREEHWSDLRTDGGWHRTYWIEQFPRVAVGCDFLAPLLLRTTASRTVAIVSEPVDEMVALGQAQRAAMRAGADDAMRTKLRKRKTRHEDRQDEVVARREDEIVSGAADTRTSGYITVHAPTVEGLAAGCRDVEQQAVKSRLRLTQLSRQQAVAFTYTLPLTRGIRPSFGRKKK